MKFHHIGLICGNIDKEKASVKKTHKVIFESQNIFDSAQNVTVCLLKTKEGPNIELVSGKKVEQLAKKGVGYYHLCYEVEDMGKAIKKLLKDGGVLISSPEPARLFNMRKVAFLYMSYGILELLEGEKK